MIKDLAYQVRYTGAGYFDDKMNPVANLAELNSKFDTTELVKGMTVTVQDDGEGNMADFVWDGSQWIKKTGGEGQTYEAGQYVNIENNVISVTGITPDSYATKDELTAATENLATKNEVEEAVSGKADASAITEFVTSGEVETLIEKAITGITPTEYQAGEYISIENNVISVTGISTDSFATKDELTAATENLATKDELTAVTENLATKDELTAATENLATKDELTAATENLATKDELTAVTEDFATKKELAEAKATIEDELVILGEDMLTKDEFTAATADFVNEEELQEAISDFVTEDQLTAATENLASKDELTAATENLATKDELTASTENMASKDELSVAVEAIEQELEGKSDTGHTHDDRYYTQAEVDEFLAGKSDTGHTHPAYSGGTNIDVDGLVISVTGLTSAVLANSITTQVGVGFVPSGTTFAAGTSIETILRQIFLNTSSNMVLTISLSTSDGGDITSAAPQVTVNQDTRTWEGTPLTFLVGDGVPYQISVSNVNGYSTPSPVTGVASSAEVSRSVTMTYNRQINKKYLINEVDFNELMDLMDEGVIAETPVGMLYPTNFSQQYVSEWQQGTYTGTTVSVSATSQEDVNVISIAVPTGYVISSITDEDLAQEILNLFYVQNVSMTINNTSYGKIYSRTVEGGIGSFNYTFNIVSE